MKNGRHCRPFCILELFDVVQIRIRTLRELDFDTKRSKGVPIAPLLFSQANCRESMLGDLHHRKRLATVFPLVFVDCAFLEKVHQNLAHFLNTSNVILVQKELRIFFHRCLVPQFGINCGSRCPISHSRRSAVDDCDIVVQVLHFRFLQFAPCRLHKRVLTVDLIKVNQSFTIFFKPV